MRCDWNDAVGRHLQSKVYDIISDAEHKIDSQFKLSQPKKTDEALRVAEEAERFLRETQ